jgi:hydrogenase maturation protein HypF
VGAALKSTQCLAACGEAHLSPHLGDLEHPEALALFERTAAALVATCPGGPVAVAHDLHPEYASTRWAIDQSRPTLAVQHHHAHVAACLAEHGREGPAIGVAFDGTGCGLDGSLWGGEFLRFDLGGFDRMAHLRPLSLPGGEAAIREPWRLAVAALLDAGEPLDVLHRIDAARRERIRMLCERGVSAPRATGAGRWFDAVASLAGVCDVATYEGQAAIELEAIATRERVDPYDVALESNARAPLIVDLRPAVRAVARDVRDGVPVSIVAARFHETMARAIVLVCRRLRSRGAPGLVALSGGCFQSPRLTERAAAGLEHEGFEVLIHRRVPPNDGGISFGQAAVASYLTRVRKGAAEPCA